MRTNILLSFAFCVAAAGCGEVSGGGLADADQGNPATGPNFASITPERGALAGGQTATIAGTGFSADTRVVIGGLEVNATVDSETQITVTTPAGPGPNMSVDIVLFNDNGLATAREAFTYNVEPTVASIKPRFANVGGGATITLTGTGFMVNNPGTPTVTVDGVAATNVTVVDDETITFQVPAASVPDLGIPKDVELSTFNGGATLAEVLVYTRPGLIVGQRGNSGESHALYWVDPVTGNLAQISDTTVFPFGIKRLAVNPAGEVYATTNYNGLPIALVKMDILGGAWELVGLVREGTSERRTKGAAFVGNTLYGVSNNSPESLGTINLATAAYTPVNAANELPGDRGHCLAVRDAGSLWHMSQFSLTLNQVAVATGLATPGPSLNQSANWYCHGAAVFNNTLYAVVEDRDTNCCGYAKLVSVNTTNGVVTEVIDLPRGAAGLIATPQGF